MFHTKENSSNLLSFKLQVNVISNILTKNTLLKPIKKLDTLFKTPQIVSDNASVKTIVDNWPFAQEDANKCVLLLLFNRRDEITCFLWFKETDSNNLELAIRGITHTQKKWFYTTDLKALKEHLHTNNFIRPNFTSISTSLSNQSEIVSPSHQKEECSPLDALLSAWDEEKNNSGLEKKSEDKESKRFKNHLAYS